MWMKPIPHLLLAGMQQPREALLRPGAGEVRHQCGAGHHQCVLQLPVFWKQHFPAGKWQVTYAGSTVCKHVPTCICIHLNVHVYACMYSSFRQYLYFLKYQQNRFTWCIEIVSEIGILCHVLIFLIMIYSRMCSPYIIFHYTVLYYLAFTVDGMVA